MPNKKLLGASSKIDTSTLIDWLKVPAYKRFAAITGFLLCESQMKRMIGSVSFTTCLSEINTKNKSLFLYKRLVCSQNVVDLSATVHRVHQWYRDTFQRL